MERQRSFSLKSTRFLVFSLTISSSLIFLTLFSIWVIKSTPSIHQETHFHLNQLALNLSPKPLTLETLTGFSKNSSSKNVKDLFLIDALSKPENSTLFSPPPDEAYKADDLDDNSYSTTGQESAPAPSLEEVEVHSNERIEEKKIESASTQKIERPNDEQITKKKIEAPSVEKIEVTSNEQIKKKKSGAASAKKIEVTRDKRIEEKRLRNCDITKGRWVYDESYPLYTNASCPLIDEGFNCMSNGRLDKDYMKWKWQPQDCDIPRFNATKMLDLIRGKRLIFVGDSLNRNQWESMLCMLMGAVIDPKKVYETHGRRITKEKGDYSFKFVDYKCTVEYYASHFLVHESKARVGQKRVQTLRIDSIDRGSSRWRGADILIFNTAHWWTHYKTKAGINYYQEGNLVHPQLDVSAAFRRALMTWASWVDKRINPKKTRVFFRNSAPSHFRGGQWNSGGHCREATQPLNGTSNFIYPDKNGMVEEIVKQMKTPVTLLNITRLSDYRIDAHPSMYGTKPGSRYSSNIQDCSHWCLPGVPDTWNELLYFHLLPKKEDNLL
ncbi:hypothetical protein Patl1_00880 [Pistacia atlantica]|uniref:Uncharacterized protein n=1 Tax=Pistacia atlantica TaxID=434234 RepID=A0ACC1C4N7_9ROSI|nr:hypothetical protein Patl1_00880 [Pistacia atlantica]